MPNIRSKHRLLTMFLAVLVVFVMSAGAFAGAVDQNVNNIGKNNAATKTKIS